MFKFNLLILLFFFSTQSFAQKYYTIDLSYFIETDTLFIEYIKKEPTKYSSYIYVNKISVGTIQYQEIQKTLISFNLKWEKDVDKKKGYVAYRILKAPHFFLGLRREPNILFLSIDDELYWKSINKSQLNNLLNILY